MDNFPVLRIRIRMDMQLLPNPEQHFSSRSHCEMPYEEKKDVSLNGIKSKLAVINKKIGSRTSVKITKKSKTTLLIHDRTEEYWASESKYLYGNAKIGSALNKFGSATLLQVSVLNRGV